MCNNYYSNVNEGGAAASRGFEYQDLLIMLVRKTLKV